MTSYQQIEQQSKSYMAVKQLQPVDKNDRQAQHILQFQDSTWHYFCPNQVSYVYQIP
jgi:hypothetical protein